MTNNHLSGFNGFLLVWFGQVISVIASAMTTFGMTLWMYQQTESATAMGIMQVAFITPFLVLTPFAGALVDRYNRKLIWIDAMFWETVTVNRGVPVRVFQDLKRAEEWVLT